MDQPVVALTAVFLKDKHGYTGFVEELPGDEAGLWRQPIHASLSAR